MAGHKGTEDKECPVTFLCAVSNFPVYIVQLSSPLLCTIHVQRPIFQSPTSLILFAVLRFPVSNAYSMYSFQLINVQRLFSVQCPTTECPMPSLCKVASFPMSSVYSVYTVVYSVQLSGVKFLFCAQCPTYILCTVSTLQCPVSFLCQFPTFLCPLSMVSKFPVSSVYSVNGVKVYSVLSKNYSKCTVQF